jgi:hypothetical protein
MRLVAAWKRRDSDGRILWSVPEDALAAFAIEHPTPTWELFDAWAAKGRGAREARIEVYPETLVAVCDAIRERGDHDRQLAEAAAKLRSWFGLDRCVTRAHSERAKLVRRAKKERAEERAERELWCVLPPPAANDEDGK